MLPLLHAPSDGELAHDLQQALARFGVVAQARVARGRAAAREIRGHDGNALILLMRQPGVGHRAAVDAARADGARVIVVTGPAAPMPREWRDLDEEPLAPEPAAAGSPPNVARAAERIAHRLGRVPAVAEPGAPTTTVAPTGDRAMAARGGGSGAPPSPPPRRGDGRSAGSRAGTLRVAGERLVDPTKRLDLGLLGGLAPTAEVRAREVVRVGAARAGAAPVEIAQVPPETVVAVELEGGIQLFTRYDQLRQDFGAEIDLELPTRLGGAVGRGGRGLLDIGEISLFDLDLVGVLADAGKDQLLALLRRLHPGLAQAAAPVLDDLADSLADELRGYVRAKAANLTAFGLARLSEVLFMPQPGLYRWGTPGIAEAAPIAPGELDDGRDAPWLVFLHGTASSTEGSFGDLRTADPKAPWRGEVWPGLARAYGERILALEHHTLTRSPIDNGLHLMERLPAGARLHLVSHSRGGLIGELLARAQRTDREPPFDELDLACFEGRQDQELLERLGKLLRDKQPIVECFVRVACPAAGTTLASERLDRWLSILLNVIGLIPPLAASPVYAFVRSFLLGMVETKAEPRWLPGLEAMMPDSPCSRMLNRPDVATEADLEAIAGDIEGKGILGRLALLATDWFYGGDHDLVVDTFSMAGGAPRAGALYLFDQGSDVSHFNYFENRDTVEGIRAALRGQPEQAGFVPLERPREIEAKVYGRRAAAQPVVFVLPGIMGSHLARDGNRIWLDVFDLALGRLFDLRADVTDVVATAPVGSFYAELVDWLARNHEVVPFAYDWRRSLREEAARFAQALRQSLDGTDQPVRIVAHSMGGLLARLAFALDSEAWGEFRRRERARLLMLGTPTRGSFAMARGLFGEDRLISGLALLDFRHDRGEILDLVASFPGVLELLPVDGGDDLFDQRVWRDLGAPVVPDAQALTDARETLRRLEQAPLDPNCMVYVAGKAEATPIGIVRAGGGEVRFLATERGDGRVPWETGIPAGISTWYADAEHGDLARHERAFPAYDELLARGSTLRLPDLPPARREAGRPVSFTLPRDPVARFPDQADLAAAALGGRRRLPERARRRVAVRVVHGDLRFARFPVLVGHYVGDTFAGTERTLDRALHGRLEARRRRGLYPGPVGTSEVVLEPASTPPGALVFGLGQVGKLGAADLRRGTVQATRRYLLALEETPELAPRRDRGLTALLVGSGEGGLALADALRALLEGLVEAQREAGGQGLAEIEIVELWADRAHKAAHALREVVDGSPSLRDAVDAASTLEARGGGCHRAFPAEDRTWWQRLLIEKDEAGGLRFTTLHTERARAEVSLVPHQRALAERFLARAVGHATFASHDVNPGVALYELLMPNRLKGAQARDGRPLVLALDRTAAAYPWELLVDRRGTDDGESRPLAVEVPMVRQLLEVEFRERPLEGGDALALVVGDPPSRFAELPGARREARAVADRLAGTGFQVTRQIAGGLEIAPESVVGALFAQDWKIVHLAAHGVVDEDLARLRGEPEPSGERVTGMVLGEDLFLTPELIEQMRTVPRLVFLNCCFLGKVDDVLEARARAGRHRLAANLATQLIKMGVRAVVAAGWAVDDLAAQRFAEIFYDRILAGEEFGQALHAARQSVHAEYPLTATWGAYQAYGDPAWRLRHTEEGTQDGSARRDRTFVGLEECQIELDNLVNDARGVGDRPDQRARVRETLDAILTAAERCGWANAPEVLASAGGVAADLGDFDRAIQFYERAIGADARKVPIRVVEQLANLRVREASAKAAVGRTDEALDDIGRALESLEALLKVAGRTAERLALLGSAMKRKAMLMPEGGGKEALEEMRRWYDEAATKAEESRPADPYQRTNACLADLLLRLCYGEDLTADFDARLAAAAEDADERYRRSPDFWSAVAKPDLELIARLRDRTLPTQVEALVEAYADAARLLASPREFGSVLEHLDFIEAMLAEGTTPAAEREPLQRAVRDLRDRLAVRVGGR